MIGIARSKGRELLMAFALLALSSAGIAEAQAKFAVDFTWEGTASCFDPKSPPFTLSGVPADTKRLRFAMKDLDAPSYPHGGGTVPYQGQSRIERGAFTYQGPCPPQGQHRYQWTIDAQDGAGKTLATTTATKNFPPK
jgi:phosphatidylethanolamine-binding protein (PEBP) family uncharacterized protein